MVNLECVKAKKKFNANEVCRLCNCNLKVVYGSCVSKKSFINIFKPSSRQESLGVVWADRLLLIGIRVENSVHSSQVVCNVCGRKIKNLCELFSFVSNGFGGKENTFVVSENRKEKRKSSTLTPEKSSPASRKSRRIDSPLTKAKRNGEQGNNVKKSLSFSSKENVNMSEKQLQDNIISNLNIDDLNTTDSAAVKVVIAYPNGRVVVKSNFDKNTTAIVRDICLSRWKPVANAFLRHEFLPKELIMQCFRSRS